MHAKPALKARFIQKPSSAIVAPCRGRLAKSSFTQSSAQKTAIHGWMPMFGRECTPILRPSAAMRARKPSASAGVADHVHLVTTLPRTLTQADMLEGLKKKSSKWIKGIAPNYRHFYWQRGYGAFSVSPSQLDPLLQYVEMQEEHHRSRTFQEEYREFLRKHGVGYDERYVWD
jgi:putative transposase